MDIKKTANLLINFTIRRIAEIFGIIIFLVNILAGVFIDNTGRQVSPYLSEENNGT